MTVAMNQIIGALQEYQGRYRYLDVFHFSLQDLEALAWHPIQNNTFVSNVLGVQLCLQPLGEGVLRFYLGAAETPTIGSGTPLAGAALGAVIGAASSDDKTAVLSGMVLGLLVGAIAGVGAPEMNRVMALRYDPRMPGWRVYDGPLVAWAKNNLAP